MNPIDAILAERSTSHGDFTDSARASHRLQEVIADEHGKRLARNQQTLLYTQLNALNMIAHKIGRILAGDPNHADHWDDIAGYAKLISKRVTGEAINPVMDKAAVDEFHSRYKASQDFPLDEKQKALLTTGYVTDIIDGKPQSRPPHEPYVERDSNEGITPDTLSDTEEYKWTYEGP